MSDSQIEPLAAKPRWESLRRKRLDGGPPQFAVRHLILAVTMSAVHLAFVRLFAENESFGQDAPASALVLLVWQSVLIGVAYTGAVLLALRLLGRTTWRIDPGHWILAAIGLAAAVQTSAEFINYLSPHRDILAAVSIHVTILGVALTAPLLSRSTSTNWKVCITAMLLVTWGRLWIEVQWSGWGLVPPIATLSFLGLAIWMDQDRTERGWFHWAGIAVWIFSRCLPPLMIWVLR